MFDELRERLGALREFHSVHGLSWAWPEEVWQINRWIWFAGILQVLAHTLFPSWRNQPLPTEIQIQVQVCLLFSVISALLCGLINAWRNLPLIIPFPSRDPTFEDE